MKKKVLFVIVDFCHGGPNKSLENLLHFIDKKKFDISIFALYEDGVSLYRNIYAPYILHKSFLYYLAHDNLVTRKLMGALKKLSPKVNFNWLYRYEVNRLQRKHHFDTIVAYMESFPTNFVSRLKDSQINTVAWVHCDYNCHLSATRGKNEFDEYSKFKHIVCVSKEALGAFTEAYPQLKNRTTFIYNTIDIKAICQLAKFDLGRDNFDNKYFNIVSVGRYAGGKQFEKIPDICHGITKLSSRPFRWYIIGGGEQYWINLTLKGIQSYKLHGTIIFLGGKSNPYPFIQQANLLVSTSAIESWSYVIAEAKALGTPVLANNYPVASEVVPPECGWVCPLDDMPQLIADIMADKNGMYSRIKQKHSNGLPNNKTLIAQVENIL